MRGRRQAPQLDSEPGAQRRVPRTLNCVMLSSDARTTTLHHRTRTGPTVSSVHLCPITYVFAPRSIMRSHHPPRANVRASETIPATSRWVSRFFFGSDKIWTLLSGHPWKGIPAADGLRLKVPWFAAGLKPEEQMNPQISISGRCLNHAEAHMRVEALNTGFIADYYFFPSTLIFSTDGCWEITAKRKADELKIVAIVIK